ncbi:MAG TPA: MFS transporter, partial [Bradyrhizobium sp.]|nr:MFS transporter [Bradyrhizobium sp.]
MTAIPADSVEAARPLDSTAKKALAAASIGYAMDGFDLLILGFMLRAISADLHLTPAQAGSLVTWTLTGAVAGGILFGILSDYYGRVRVLTWTILLFAVFTGLGAMAQGYWDLLIYRTIAGLGLGGEFGIGMTLVAETWPARHRARGCAYVALGWQAGVLTAALVTPLLLPSIGWRGMFLVGLVPGLIAFAVRWYVGEPKIFLDRVAAARGRVPLGLLVKDAATTKISAAMLILCSVQNFGYYGLMIWLPSYLSTRFGYTLTQSAVWTAVTVLGMALGIWIFGQ